MIRTAAIVFCIVACFQLPSYAQHKKGKKTVVKKAAKSDKSSEKTSGPQFRFKEGDAFNFGAVPSGPDVFHEFTFVNTGDQPLIIQNVQVSYGCTNAEWTRHPVVPGGKGFIKVGYHPSKQGPFSREVYIQSNAPASGNVKGFTLYIRGMVGEPKEPAAARDNNKG